MTRRPSVILFTVLLAVPGCEDDGGQSPPDAPLGQIDASPPDAPPGNVCGGGGDLDCPATQYCDYAENGCGAADETGVCRDRPIGCPDTAALVFQAHCGCDRVVYGNDCDAYAAGTDLNRYGSCPVPAGSFACGWLQCELMTQYCQHTISDVVGEPDGYACMPIPACPSQLPNCACLATEPCGDACTGDAVVGLTVTCPGG
jgi:hypothetical protein